MQQVGRKETFYCCWSFLIKKLCRVFQPLRHCYKFILETHSNNTQTQKNLTNKNQNTLNTIRNTVQVCALCNSKQVKSIMFMVLSMGNKEEKKWKKYYL